jgi:hypothetical protein
MPVSGRRGIGGRRGGRPARGAAPFALGLAVALGATALAVAAPGPSGTSTTTITATTTGSTTTAPPAAPPPAYAPRCRAGQVLVGGRCRAVATTTRSTPAPPAVRAATSAAIGPQAAPGVKRKPTLVKRKRSKVVLPHLIRPRTRVVLSAGRAVSLRWRKDRRARYYNVQLYRGKQKVYTRWPGGLRLRLPGELMARGRVALVIWSGIGPRRRARYVRTPWVARLLVIRAARPVATARR